MARWKREVTKLAAAGSVISHKLNPAEFRRASRIFHGRGEKQNGCTVFGNLNKEHWIAAARREGFLVQDLGDHARYFKNI